MLYEISFMLNLTYMEYFLIGLGIGIASYYIFYDNNSSTELDRMKHDLEVKKEWIRMVAEQNKEKAKTAAWNAKFARTR